jgi:hypothetical protein
VEERPSTSFTRRSGISHLACKVSDCSARLISAMRHCARVYCLLERKVCNSVPTRSVVFSEM